ncbi:MAG TPA: YndM family protein [Ureibacillus sp.]|nr:YndM family protein [Ureibacillus sp.]
MHYTKAFFIKLVMTLVFLWLVLGLFFDASIGSILLIGVIITVVGFIGDVFLLPRVGNFIAGAGDFVLVLLGVWAIGSVLFIPGIAVFSAAFLSALFVAVGELYFHRYYRDNVMEKVSGKKKYIHFGNLRTEFSHDFDEGIEKIKENNKDE